MSSAPVTAARFAAAMTIDEYVAAAVANAELWAAIRRRAAVTDEEVARAAALGPWHLLALSEDWCGDAVNMLPVFARLAERAPNLVLRITGRDANPDLMDAHLTNGSRSIPVIIAYDDAFVERAWWGPRPAELQRWVVGEGRALDKEARYRHVRGWYARDRGRTAVAELLGALEAAPR